MRKLNPEIVKSWIRFQVRNNFLWILNPTLKKALGVTRTFPQIKCTVPVGTYFPYGTLPLSVERVGLVLFSYLFVARGVPDVPPPLSTQMHELKKSVDGRGGGRGAQLTPITSRSEDVEQ